MFEQEDNLPAEPRWARCVVELRGPGEVLCAELVGELSERTGALGAAQTGQDADADVFEWTLFYPESHDTQDVENALQALADERLGSLPGAIGVKWRWEAQPREDWALAWREFFQPIEIGGRFRIVPPWAAQGDPSADFRAHLEEAAGNAAKIGDQTSFPPPAVPGKAINVAWRKSLPVPDSAWAQIVIDPGQGFGTGQHETTRLALEAVAELARPGMRVLDVGSGSGILSIGAALLGAVEITAVEIDPAANENARENFRLNGVEDRIRLIEGGPECVPGGARFDLVVCNVLLSNAEKFFHLLPPQTAPGGALILSGFLSRDRERAEGLFPRRAPGGGLEAGVPRESSQGPVPPPGGFESYAEAGEWGRLVWRKGQDAG